MSCSCWALLAEPFPRASGHGAEWQRCGQADVGVRGPAPDVGEHTDSVLREAGLSEAELAALKEVGAVGAATDQMKGPLATWMQGAK